MRSFRTIGIREVSEDNAVALAVIPYFSMEDLAQLELHVHIASNPKVGQSFAFMGQVGVLEYNFTALAVPYNVISTLALQDTEGLQTFGYPSATAHWDHALRRILITTTGRES